MLLRKYPSVLLIYTGGTIGMIQNPETGALETFNFDHLQNHVSELKRFNYHISTYQFNPPIDSSDMEPTLWAKIVKIIHYNYDRYDGFVILHGTDTMSYTASALSFMLENLTKPVIFTGSQLPIGTIRTDGRENLIAALEIAAAYLEDKAIVPEVCILFGDKLFRGNRTTKVNAESFDAFQSFNYPPLAEIGIHIHYNYGAIDYTPRIGELSVFTPMNTGIAILQLFPGLRPEVIEAIVKTPGIKGIILETYGSGNAPTDKVFLAKIKEAANNGIIIYNVTQCLGGTVEMGRYETSRKLLKYGVSSGYDITMEAAICKMMHLLAKYEDSNEIKKYLNSSIKGEISVNHIGF